MEQFLHGKKVTCFILTWGSNRPQMYRVRIERGNINLLSEFFHMCFWLTRAWGEGTFHTFCTTEISMFRMNYGIIYTNFCVTFKGFWTTRPSSIPFLSHPVPFFQPRSTRPRTTHPSLFAYLSLTIYFTSHVGARTHKLCIMNHYRYHYTSGSVASQRVNVL